MNEPTDKPRYSQPWLLGISNLPYGVSGAYVGIAMPYLLHKAGIPISTVGAIGALCILPSAYKIFWVPILDIGLRRRTWLVICAFIGSLCLGGSLLCRLPDQLGLYEILMVLGQAMTGMVASCNGGLVCTTVDPQKRGQASGWVNAANLGGAALGGGVVLSLANDVSMHIAAVALTLMVMLPSLAALAVREDAPLKEPVFERLSAMASEVWKVVKSKPGWTGLLLCSSPVGTVALTNLFSALGDDYHASHHIVELVNGYAGGVVTAGGALVAGYILDRADRRKVYLIGGLLTTVVAFSMSMGPLTPETFIIGCLGYAVVAGLNYAAFSALVYEIVGEAGKSAATLYTVFPAAGNQAIAYTLFLDSYAHNKQGAAGCLWMDAALNLGGVVVLFILLRIISAFKQKDPSKDIFLQE